MGKAFTGFSRVGKSTNARRKDWNGRGRADTKKDKEKQKRADEKAQEYYNRTGEYRWGPG